MDMTLGGQCDLGGAADEQEKAFSDHSSRVYRADPEDVRTELHRILLEARAAQKMPWGPNRVSAYRSIFPQMTSWLPEEEGAQFLFDFEAELTRLEAA